MVSCLTSGSNRETKGGKRTVFLLERAITKLKCFKFSHRFIKSSSLYICSKIYKEKVCYILGKRWPCTPTWGGWVSNSSNAEKNFIQKKDPGNTSSTAQPSDTCFCCHKLGHWAAEGKRDIKQSVAGKAEVFLLWSARPHTISMAQEKWKTTIEG